MPKAARMVVTRESASRQRRNVSRVRYVSYHYRDSNSAALAVSAPIRELHFETGYGGVSNVKRTPKEERDLNVASSAHLARGARLTNHDLGWHNFLNDQDELHIKHNIQ